MYMGVKFQIFPTKEQEEYLFRCCKAQHDLRNFLVAKFQAKLPDRVSNMGIIGYKDTDLQRDMYVANIPTRIYRSTLANYAETVSRYYNKLSQKPKFHKFNPSKRSFNIVDRAYLIKNYTIKLPSYKGNSIYLDIQLDKKTIDKYHITALKEVHYKYENGRWFLSGCYEVPDVSIDKSKEFLGIDWGIKNFITTSDGRVFNYPKSVTRQYKRIQKLQHYLDKKVKDSNNYNKLKCKINAAYKRMNNLKRNFVEQVTTMLCREYHICIEDISITSISKGKSKKFIRQKNVVAPLYMFKEKLEWKCKKFGSYYELVPPEYTSMTCSNCGTIKEDLKLRDRVYVCECCGLEIDRDINAAINIRERGKANLSQ